MEKLYRYRVVFLLTITLMQTLNTTAHKYSTSFHTFPPLYNFDDYDVCLSSGISKFESTYCMIYAEIQPQNSSELWKQIAQHTDKYKFHFRRDRLFFGVCMERCKNFPKVLDHHMRSSDTRVINEITEYFNLVHKRPLDLEMRLKYHELVHNCLNSEFQNKFGLNLKTYIEYCERPGKIVEKDNLEKILFKFFEIIIILNVLSTLYDYCLKKQQPEEHQNSDYYKVNPQQPVSTLLTSFSVRRNYYRLVEPSTSQLGIDLAYLDGVRSVCVISVLAGHAFFVQYHHVKNPENFEQFAKSPIHLWLTNGTLLLELFHVISGMLLYIKFKEFFNITPQTSGRECLMVYFKGMMLRYIRFLPSLALFVFVNATFFTRLQDGPFWRHLTEPGHTFAREKWWKKLLIFDNISDMDFPHTWYMTADWQLFSFYFGLLIILDKYPQYKRKTLTALTFLAVFIPFSVSYYHKLEPCFLISPETFRYILVHNDDTFYKLYTPFYCNIGGYLLGIVCGEIYRKYVHNEEIIKYVSRIPTKIPQIAVWIYITLCLWICWLGSVIIFKEPSFWTALYAGLNRNLFLLIAFGGAVLLGLFFKSLPTSDFLSHTVFRILSRLSFQIYIWHFSVLFLLNGHKREPVFTNHLQHLITTICLFLFSIALSFVIAILIEYPCHKLTYCYYKRGGLSKPEHLKS